MTWLRLEDTLPTNAKVLRCSTTARYLYVVGLCHAGNNRTDGHLEAAVVPLLFGLSMAGPEHVDELIENGLWHAFEDGYGINDYLEYQTSRAEIEAKLRKDAERKRNARRRRDVRTDGTTDSAPDVGPDGHAESAHDSATHITSHHITSPPPLNRQEPTPDGEPSTVWGKARDAGIPEGVIERASYDFANTEPTEGQLADHIAGRYTPPTRRHDMDDAYQRHGNPSKAVQPLTALAHRAGWTRQPAA